MKESEEKRERVKYLLNVREQIESNIEYFKEIHCREMLMNVRNGGGKSRHFWGDLYVSYEAKNSIDKKENEARFESVETRQ